MAGRIPRSFIDDLLARTDVVEIIDARVPLKKAGRNYQACCPFHNEKSPSFTVSQEKQFYHCFGCGAHGNAISFLMEYERLEFPEAVEELAQYHQLPVPREQGGPSVSPAQKQQQQDDYQLMEQAARFFAAQLKQHHNGQSAIDYLKQRGLTGEVVRQFGIGYAPPEWDSIGKAFGTNLGRQQQLLDLKLLSANDQGRRYDFFRDRIMFPIRDKRGRVVGFGGRVLGDGSPKYLNSPETRVFHKGHELYGFYQARQAHRKLQRLIIVEGYMDVVALAQFGIDYAVAALGTATTPEHIQMLFRATSEVICCYDGDRAGRDAAWRALENALPHLKDGVEMKFLFLPDGEDPDTLVRQIGQDAFEVLLDDALPLSTFFFESLLQQHQVGSTEGKANLKAQAEPLISQVQGEHQRDLLQQNLSKLTGEQDTYRFQRDQQKANSQQKSKTVDLSRPQETRLSLVATMLRLLLDSPELAQQCGDIDAEGLASLNVKGMGLLIEVYQVCIGNPNYSTAQLIEHFRGHPHYAHLGKLMLRENLVEPEEAQKLYQDSFIKLVEQQLRGRMGELVARIRVSGKNSLTEDEQEELKQLSQSLGR